jgi:hypothetical protein
MLLMSEKNLSRLLPPLYSLETPRELEKDDNLTATPIPKPKSHERPSSTQPLKVCLKPFSTPVALGPQAPGRIRTVLSFRAVVKAGRPKE